MFGFDVDGNAIRTQARPLWVNLLGHVDAVEFTAVNGPATLCFDDSATCPAIAAAGETWRDLFDLVIVSAAKPRFFAEQGSIYRLVDAEHGLLEPHFGPLEAMLIRRRAASSEKLLGKLATART